MRVIMPEAFAMTCGVIVPVDAMLLDEVFEEVLGRIRGEADAIANDRRFATTIYRMAVLEGPIDQVRLRRSKLITLTARKKWPKSS